MTLPHQQAAKQGQSVPVTRGPSNLVRERQSEAPHCGSHAAYRKLSPCAPPRSCHFTVYPLATTHLASHTTVPCPAVRKHLGSTVDFIPSAGLSPCLILAGFLSANQSKKKKKKKINYKMALQSVSG